MKIAYKYMPLINYTKALTLQKTLLDAFIKKPNNNSKFSQIVLFLQHTNTFTAGRRIKHDPETPNPVLKNKDQVADIVYVDRGGEWTYHGPGQLIAYPIVDLNALGLTPRKYVKTLENSMIKTCEGFGIKAGTTEHTGVWVKDEKIGAIGVSIHKRWCMHGLSVNVNCDLDWFKLIVPCGLKDKGVTSIEKEMKRNVKVEDVLPHLIKSFEKEWNAELYPLEDLDSYLKD